MTCDDCTGDKQTFDLCYARAQQPAARLASIINWAGDLPAHRSSFVSGNDKDVALSGEGTTFTLSNVAISINGPDRAEINDFVGQSKSRRLPSGELEFTTGEPPLQGRPNEPSV